MNVPTFLATLFLCSIATAQVGIGTTTPDPSSVLDVSASDKGILIPRVSLSDINSAIPITNPATGLLVYNTNASIVSGTGAGFYYWNGSLWVVLNKGIKTLDLAYDGGGTGAGRIISADAGALEINGTGGLWVNADNPSQSSAVQVDNTDGDMISSVDLSYINTTAGNNLMGVRSISEITSTTGLFDGSYGVYGLTRHPTDGLIDLNATSNSLNKAVGIGGGIASRTSFTGSKGDIIAAVYGATGLHNSNGGTVSGGARLYSGLFSGNGRTLGLMGENSTYIELIPRNQVQDYDAGVIGFYNSGSNGGNNGANIGTGDTYFSIEANVSDATQKDLVLQTRTTGNVGVGTAAPSEKLHVSGGIRASSLSGTGNRLVQSDTNGVLSNIADGANGQVLTTDGTGNMSWKNTSSNPAWELSGNTGTNPNVNFLGTSDNQDLVFRTNNSENMRINTDGNIGIGTQSNLARLYTFLPNTNTSTAYGIYNNMDGATTTLTYGFYNRNNSSTNSTKYGIFNNVNNEGTGNHYGIMNYTYMNAATTNGTGYGQYNYLSSYGTGNHRASFNSLYHNGTAVSQDNFASYNLVNIGVSSNTSTIYGEYTAVDFSAGSSYGEFKEMNSNAGYTSSMFGDYNQMTGSGNGASYAVFNDFNNTGTGAKYGVRNEFDDIVGNKYGLYNNFSNGNATGNIYGVFNNIQSDANAAKYGSYNLINGGNGTLAGTYNSVLPATTNTSAIYGVYGAVSPNGSGLHYGGYFNAQGSGNRAVYGINTHLNGWAAYFMGRGYFSGNVGIGSNNPSQAKLVVNGTNANQTVSNHAYLLSNGSIGTTTNSPKSYSIWATGRIAASEFNAFSDARIKNIIGQSNTELDLNILSAIKVTNYTFKDSIAKGSKRYKKVIAQELKQVYPQAVSNTTSAVIPNIYQLAEIKNGWISLKTNHIKVGDKVKLIFNDTEDLVMVTEVEGHAIKTDTRKQGEVFVYGTEVHDFHTVDYEAIAMLNVSATQALLKRIEQLEQDKQDLTAELLKNQEDTNKRILAIEQLLLGTETADK